MNKNYIIYYINKISFILLWFLGVANGADMEVVIHHTYGGNPLLFDSLRYQTTQDESFSVTRLSYLFSGVSLEDDKGKLHNKKTMGILLSMKLVMR